ICIRTTRDKQLILDVVLANQNITLKGCPKGILFFFSPSNAKIEYNYDSRISIPFFNFAN
ncbi:MAG: hypothetical protein KAY93_05820, partial [Parabacteroides sp.]|nr:hypothetical protein [Parabacteroides sp.]